MNVLIYFLPAIIFLGIITSYQDIKQGKIRNKWIILALSYAFLINFALIVYFYFTTGLNTQYLIELSTNLLFAIIIGFGFWYFSVWSAGDGKLFIAFSALLPLSIYINGYQEWIPSITLLINIFVPALVIMFVTMLFKIKPKNLKITLKVFLKEFFQPKQLFNSVVSLFAFYWVVQLLLPLIGLGDSYILRIALTVLIFLAIQKKLRDKSLYILLIISLIRFAVDKSIYSFSFLIDFLILVFIWRLLISFLRGSISKIGHEAFSKNLKVNQLTPGMILSETIQKKEKINKQELMILKEQQNTKIIKHKGHYLIQKPKPLLGLDNFIGEEAEGLTKEQIDKIRKLGVKNIKISQTTPFAPFISLGVILTILANGNILIVILNLI